MKIRASQAERAEWHAQSPLRWVIALGSGAPGLEGSEKRAQEAARSNGISVRYGWRRDEFYTLKYSMLEERLEQVREIDGELAYEKMRRAVEKASQEKARQARQVERARLEGDRQETARQSRDRRGPERGGPERDFGPSR